MTSSEAIAEIESIVGLRLPNDYRSWLADPEARYPVPSDVTIPNESPWTDEVERLYAAEQVLSDLKQQRDLLHSGIRDFPSQTLLIGDNDLGDHYLLSLRPDDFGSVYFYFHETANPDEDDNSGVYVLCRTFADWLNSLERKEPDPAVPDWDRIREEERARILAAPRKRWWEFWK
jgi:hypothetical protein